MKYSIILLLSALLLCACRQDVYEVGTSCVSIEPGDETISLALAGYAGPFMGRFTITWEDKGVLTDAAAMAGLGDRIFVALNNGDIFSMENGDPATIQKQGQLRNVEFIAGYKDKLYAIDRNGNLSISQPGSGLQWEKQGNISGATAFTASAGNLYAATGKDGLMMGTVNENGVFWENAGPADNIVSLACDARRLYAVTADNILLQRDLKSGGGEWIRIGYRNDDTYAIDVKEIVHAMNKLYALAADNHIYESRHSTEGNLSARSMAIKKGNDVAVIVSIDVCGIDYSFTESIRREMNRRRGIPEEAVMINSTHTHFAPTAQNWPTWGVQNQRPDSIYFNEVLRDGIIRSIEQALDNTVPSHLSFGRDTTDIGYNRSIRKESYVYDNSVDVIEAVATDGAAKTLMFLAGCHPVFADPASGHYSASANFPGYAREILERAGYRNPLFLQGCAGDINPKAPFRTSGMMLAADVIRALGKDMAPVNGDISFAEDSIVISTDPWPKEKVQAFRDGSVKSVRPNIPGGCESSPPNRDVIWSDMMLGHYENGTMPQSMTVHIHTINIGDWKLVALSREVTTEFSIAIRELWPGENVSVAGYSNDVSSYLATDPHIEAADYEGYESFLWYGQVSTFPLGTFGKVIDKIKTSDN